MFTAQEYQGALELIRDRITPKQIDVLQILCNASSTGISAVELSRRLGGLAYQSQIWHYSRFARMLSDVLDFAPTVRENGTKRWWPLIFTGNAGRDTSGSFILKLHPELVHALYASNIVNADSDFPEEIKPSPSYPEGAKKQITVNAYERNPQARRECIARHRAVCTICEFDFSKIYGEIGTGFIHVHHLKQLSDIGERYEVNPVEDLKPVCPNCHAMLHRRTPPYSIEEIQTFIENQSEKRKDSF